MLNQIKDVFLDTSFVQAYMSRRDRYHPVAVRLRAVLETATVWTTEAVLIEVGDGLSVGYRGEVSAFIEEAYAIPNFQVDRLDTDRLQEALRLYRDRDDKEWGLTDCLSFLSMRRNGITAALTADHHFVQAGFRALMLEEP